MQSAEKNKGSGKCAGEAGAGLCHPQPPSQEGRAERGQSRAAETLDDVQRSCRHWQVALSDGSVCRRDGGNADCAQAHSAHEKSAPEHDKDQSVAGQIEKWQRSGEGQKRASGRYLSYPEPQGQGAYPWIGTDHPHSKRSQQPARRARRLATGADEIDRNQHLARERDSVRHELRGGGRREGSAFEKLQVDERSISFADCHSEEERKQNYGNQESRKTNTLAQMIRPIQEEYESRREQGEARKIEFSRPGLVAIIGQKENRQDDCQYTDRQVDQEEPAPGSVLQNGTGDDRAKDRPYQDWHRRVAHEARHMLSGSTRHHHLRQRSHQAAAHALEDAKSDQRVRRPGQTA